MTILSLRLCVPLKLFNQLAYFCEIQYGDHAIEGYFDARGSIPGQGKGFLL
jgi:hypothetical protein